jgi:hypothetical protein
MANEIIKAIAHNGQITNLTNTTSSKAIIDLIYPVGATFISFDNTFDPNTAWNGTTWEKIKEGIFLEATEVAADVGTEKEAGVPNITGSVNFHMNAMSIVTGAFYAGDSYTFEFTPKSGTNYNKYCKFYFDASRSSAVYGKSDTVQPHSVKAFIWKRTA